MNDFEYLEELRQKRAKNQENFHSNEQNRSSLEEIGREKEPEYTGSSYLYIKSTVNDDGSRPMQPETIFWQSPAITLYDDTNSTLISSTLKTRTEYVIQIIVSNIGDHDCHAATVELLFADPSIGFSVEYASQIGIQSVSIPSRSNVLVKFPFSVENSDSGHKCLFARAYSFGTNNYPLDFEYLDPVTDRLTAQKNILIVKQNEFFHFDVVKRQNQSSKLKLILVQGSRRLSFYEGFNLDNEYFQNADFIVTRLQMDIENNTEKKLEEIEKNSWIYYEFNEEINKMKLYLPSLELKEQEGVLMNIVAQDLENENIIGGITILVTK